MNRRALKSASYLLGAAASAVIWLNLPAAQAADAAAWVDAPPAARHLVAGRGNPDAVIRWNSATLSEIRRSSTAPPQSARALAVVSVAMHDSLSATRRGGPGRRAAANAIVTGAAWRALNFLFPARRQHFASVAESMVGDGPRARLGLRIGELTADEVIRRARRDGSRNPWFGKVPQGEGLWVPGATGGPADPRIARWRPWNFEAKAMPTVPPPPTFGSRRYEAQVDRVYVSRSDIERGLASS